MGCESCKSKSAGKRKRNQIGVKEKAVFLTNVGRNSTSIMMGINERYGAENIVTAEAFADNGDSLPGMMAVYVKIAAYRAVGGIKHAET